MIIGAWDVLMGLDVPAGTQRGGVLERARGKFLSDTGNNCGAVVRDGHTSRGRCGVFHGLWMEADDLRGNDHLELIGLRFGPEHHLLQQKRRQSAFKVQRGMWDAGRTAGLRYPRTSAERHE